LIGARHATRALLLVVIVALAHHLNVAVMLLLLTQNAKPTSLISTRKERKRHFVCLFVGCVARGYECTKRTQCANVVIAHPIFEIPISRKDFLKAQHQMHIMSNVDDDQ
jgi:rRNA pseudouridine-1189 N-methylase Emg1 (Nep1/Mra1 family)